MSFGKRHAYMILYASEAIGNTGIDTIMAGNSETVAAVFIYL